MITILALAEAAARCKIPPKPEGLGYIKQHFIEIHLVLVPCLPIQKKRLKYFHFFQFYLNIFLKQFAAHLFPQSRYTHVNQTQAIFG